MGREDYGRDCYKMTSESLTIDNVPSTMKSVFDYIDRRGVPSLRIDMSEVEEIGSAGVALLVGMRRKVEYLELENVSKGVRDRIELSKLGRLLLANRAI